MGVLEWLSFQKDRYAEEQAVSGKQKIFIGLHLCLSGSVAKTIKFYGHILPISGSGQQVLET